MTSYLRKYVTALASAKDYISQWSADRVLADEALIVPFPTLAIFDPDKHVWSVNIKAWLYLPFEGKKIKSYIPSLPLSSLFTRKTAGATNNEEHEEEEKQPDKEKKSTIDSVKYERKSSDNEKIAALTEEARVIKKIQDSSGKKNDKEEEEEEEKDEDIYEDASDGEIPDPSENPGRLGLFFVGNSVKVVTKSIINGVEHLLQPSDESGFIEETIELSEEEICSFCSTIHPQSKDRKFDYEIQLNETKKDPSQESTNDIYRAFTCTIYVLATHGVSVISDIDDTIKVSHVLNKRSLLKHTFYSYFKPVEGMNELYQRWSEEQCQFHYISASPWQLYPALRCFLEKHQFPLGTINLRKFSWDLKFFHPADSYKIETITKVIDAYPQRKYICVGDSGELDPEIYSKLYKMYPQAIVHIFIRDVCRLPICLPTCQERYTKVFADIPQWQWTVFKEAKEIETNIDQLLHVQKILQTS